MSRRQQTETKVAAGSVSASGALVLLYLLAQIPFVAGMPEIVQGGLGVLVLAGITWAGGWLAPHTSRTPPAPVPVQVIDVQGRHELEVRDDRGATDAQQAFAVVVVLLVGAIAAAVLFA